MNSIGLSADQGIDGVILWGNSNFRKNCTAVKNYLDGTLGPYVQRVLNFTQQCSRDVCNSHGRCEKKYIETDVDKIDQDVNKDHVYDADQAAADYKCRCYEGWSGESCGTEN